MLFLVKRIYEKSLLESFMKKICCMFCVSSTHTIVTQFVEEYASEMFSEVDQVIKKANKIDGVVSFLH